MATIKIRHFVEKSGGRLYWQPSDGLRAAGFQTRRLSDDRALAIAEAQRLNDQVDAWRQVKASGGAAAALRTARSADRSINSLIAKWKAAEDWKELSAKTQDTYRYCLAGIAAWSGDAPVGSITGELVAKFYRSMLKTPGKAHATIRVLRTLLEFGRRSGWLAVNPALKPKIQDRARKGRLWSKPAIAAFVAAADRLGWHSVGTAVLLNEWIGQREGDVIRLSRAHYRNGTLAVKQAKTGADVELPVDLVPHLVARLEAELARTATLKVQPTTILVCESTGRPWKEFHFRHVVAEIRAAAVAGFPAERSAAASGGVGGAAAASELKPCQELDGLWFMHLRHTAITRLAEANCSNGLIATITGHSQATVQQMIDRYMIRTSAMARAAFRQRLEKEQA